jgi:hypothetical protein
MSNNNTPQYIIQDMGESPISRKNGVFYFCKNLDVVDSMNIGESRSVTFQSGAGKTVANVFRHS